MFHSFDHRQSTLTAVFAFAVCILATAGCEKEYKPAPYKAAPRVDAAMLGDSDSNPASGQVPLPNVTDWTSPDAIRATRKFAPPKIGRFYAGNAYRGNAYRGYGGYAGISRGAYSGMAGRGGYRGYGKSPAYRGYRKLGNSYRGNSNQPSSSYRGYRN